MKLIKVGHGQRSGGEIAKNPIGTEKDTCLALENQYYSRLEAYRKALKEYLLAHGYMDEQEFDTDDNLFYDLIALSL